MHIISHNINKFCCNGLRFLSNCGSSHYDTLGISKDCSSKQIKDAYIKLSKKYHPDTNQQNDAHKKFVKLTDAYRVLSKPDLRKSYDSSLGTPGSNHGENMHTYENYKTEIHKKYGWPDPSSYANEGQHSETISGKRFSNSIVASFCVCLAMVGFLLQMLAIKNSFTLKRDNMIEVSKKASENLAKVKSEAEKNGNLLQLQLLEERMSRRNEIGWGDSPFYKRRKPGKIYIRNRAVSIMRIAVFIILAASIIEIIDIRNTYHLQRDKIFFGSNWVSRGLMTARNADENTSKVQIHLEERLKQQKTDDKNAD